jgi:hypothetical protein
MEPEEANEAVFVGLIDGAWIDQYSHTMLAEGWITACDFLHQRSTIFHEFPTRNLAIGETLER